MERKGGGILGEARPVGYILDGEYLLNSASFECVHCLHRFNFTSFVSVMHARAFAGNPLKC